MPFMQTCPPEQARPHEPQFIGSVAVETQPVGHWVWPAPQPPPPVVVQWPVASQVEPFLRFAHTIGLVVQLGMHAPELHT